MTGRRVIGGTALVFLAGAVAGLATGAALSQSKPRMSVEVLLRRSTDEIPRKVNLEVRHDQWEPGAETGRHRHPGPVILVVLEGELSEESQEGTTALKSGQAVWRVARQEHNVTNASGKRSRVLAIHFDPAP